MADQTVLIKDVVDLLESAFPPRYQEGFDNTGLQLGSLLRRCTGALICVDLTPEILAEAVDKGCNLVITHHPLIFHPLKCIDESNRVGLTVLKAIRHDVAVYSCHTSVDNAPLTGVSWKMGEMLGLENIMPIETKGPEKIGCGIVGDLPRPMMSAEFVALVKEVFNVPVARCSAFPESIEPFSRIGLCGGAGSFLIPEAIDMGAKAFVTSDCKHNHFIDYVNRLLLVDIGHFESEECTKSIFYQTIIEKIPNFALYLSQSEKNPINYV